MKFDQVVAQQLEEYNFEFATVLRFASMQGSFNAIEDYLSKRHIAEYAGEQGITASQGEIEAVLANWRLEKKLRNAAETEEWLDARWLTTSDLMEFARMKALEEQVRSRVTAGNVERYYADHRSDFDAIALSRIEVKERSLARELRFKIMEGAEFFLLAREYSEDEHSRLAGGYVGRLERSQMHRAVAAEAFGLDPGTIVGPLEIDEKFSVIKIEQVYPAELNDETRARVERILFAEWLKRQP